MITQLLLILPSRNSSNFRECRMSEHSGSLPFFTTIASPDRVCIQILFKHQGDFTEEFVQNTLVSVHELAVDILQKHEDGSFQRKDPSSEFHMQLRETVFPVLSGLFIKCVQCLSMHSQINRSLRHPGCSRFWLFFIMFYQRRPFLFMGPDLAWKLFAYFAWKRIS